MKEKIFNSLKQNYSYLGLGDEILQAHAEALANLGLVTDDNLSQVISTQKTYLENLQKQNDRRVTEAVEKARNKAKSEFEEEAKKRSEEEKRKAEEKAKEEEEKKRKAEEERRAKEEIEKITGSEGLKKILQQRDNEIKSLREDFQKFIGEQTKNQQVVNERYELLLRESEELKAEKAKSQREKFIASKAKELGIPSWRIEEGFALKDEDDENTISEFLSRVANNIKTNSLPPDKMHSLGDDKPSKEEIDAVAKSLIK